jgi:hypothetical protein
MGRSKSDVEQCTLAKVRISGLSRRLSIGQRSSVAERSHSFTRKYRENEVAHIPLEQPDETPDTVPAR